ncbi:hypothetical protein SARC_12944, partial [Sphaeroforma arctica JP610]
MHAKVLDRYNAAGVGRTTKEVALCLCLIAIRYAGEEQILGIGGGESSTLFACMTDQQLAT